MGVNFLLSQLSQRWPKVLEKSGKCCTFADVKCKLT